MLFDIGTLLVRLSSIADEINYHQLGVTHTFPQGKSHMLNVGLYSLLVSEELGFSSPLQKELFLISMMHDLGFLSSEYIGVELHNIIQMKEHTIEHCISGEDVSKVIFNNGRCKNVISYHHENWDGSGFFSIKGKDIPLYSRILRVSEALEEKYKFDDLIENKHEVIAFIDSLEGSSFDPEISQTFMKVIRNIEVADLQRKIDYRYNIRCDIDQDRIYDVLKSIMKILDIKSNFTFNHSHRVAGLSRKIALSLGLTRYEVSMIVLAAYLHDLGKLCIPKRILEKPDALTEKEYDFIKKHSEFGYNLLKDVNGFEDLALSIKQHHEYIDGSGYPNGLTDKQITLPAKVITVADVLCSLNEDRPYRPRMSFEEIKTTLKEKFEGKLDSTILAIGLKLQFHQ